MATAGLNVTRLTGLLERRKVSCVLVEGDSGRDHCVLRLTSVKFPQTYALLEYENQGFEPRLVGILFRPEEDMNEDPFPWQKTLKLAGGQMKDPDKIVEWIDREFLHDAAKPVLRADAP